MSGGISRFRFPISVIESRYPPAPAHSVVYRQAELLSCFEIDRKLKLSRLLDRNIGGLGALLGFCRRNGGSPV
jgi:hypothetical protein